MAIRYLSGINVDNNVLFVDDANNRVGVGTGSPAYTLDVATSSSPTVRITRNGATDLRLGASIIGTGALIGTYSNSPMSFLTNSVVQAVITEAGNVGIGTTSPSDKLHVSGGVLSSYGSTNGYVSLQPGTSTVQGYVEWWKPGPIRIAYMGYNDGVSANNLAINLESSANFIVNGGNVGIGTTSPAYKLDVAGDLRSTGNIRSNNGTVDNILSWTSEPAGVVGTLSNHPETFWTNSAERMRITSAGNVGIGTTSPVAALHVQSAATKLFLSNTDFNTSTSTGSGLILHTGASSGNTYGQIYAFQSGNTSYANLVVPGGNVGIGTTSPAAKLHLSGAGATELRIASTTGNTNSLLSFYEVALASWGIDAGQANGSFFIKDLYNSATRLTILNSGNVGIGTTSPSAKLVVQGTAGNLYIDDLGAGYNYYDASNVHNFRNTAGTSRLYIDASGGNVGIGTTSPAQKLHVDGKIYAKPYLPVVLSGSGDPYYGTNLTLATDIGQTQGAVRIWSRYNSGGTATMTFEISSTDQAYNQDPQLLTYSEKMRITSAGNVGIGTTSPGYKLDVNGTGRFTAALAADSNIDLTGDLRYQSNAGFGLKSQNGTRLFEVYNTGISFVTALGGTSATFSSSVTASSLIKSGGTSSQYLMADGSVSTLTNPVTGTGTTNYVPKWTSGSAIGDSGIFDTSGNIVINGTTAINASSNRGNLTINGTSAILNFGISNVESGYIFHNGTNLDIAQVLAQPLRFLTTNAERMRIDASGNVGIGTTAPATKLEVYGGHNNTTARLYSTGDGASSNASLDMWASEPGVTYDGSGIGNNVNGHPYYGRRNALLAQSYIRFYNGGILLNTGSTTASQTVTVLASGNVGIGTTSPSYKLDVNGATQIQNELILSTNDAAFRLYRTTGINYFDWSSGQDLRFSTVTTIGGSGRSTAVTFLSDGNVGIGTTSPSGKLTLYTDGDQTLRFTHPVSGTFPRTDRIVFGSPEVDGGSSAIYGVQTAASGAPGYLSFYTTSGGSSFERMRIASTGATRLNAYGSGSFTGTVAYNLAVDSSGNIIETAGGVVDGSGTANYVSKWSDANTLTDSQLFDNGTNVGIGTTSPISKLQVNGQFRQLYSRAFISNPLDTDGYAGHIIVNSNNANGDLAGIGLYTNSSYTAAAGLFALQESSTAASMVFYAGSNLATERMRITAAGNVGIGTTSPAGKLDVRAGAGGKIILGSYDANYNVTIEGGDQLNFYNGASATTGYINYNGPGNILISRNLYVEGNSSGGTSGSVRITAAGNVGIGTTSPVEKLDVRGGAYINGGTNDNAYDATLYVTANSSNDWGIFVSKPSHDYGIISQVANGSDFGFSVYDGTTHNFRVKGNGTTLIQGNVGIGTTSPAKILTIAASSQTWAGAPQVAFYDTVSGQVDARNWTVGAISTSYGNFTIASSTAAGGDPTTPRLTINKDGNVGIGTTAPQLVGAAWTTLEVQGQSAGGGGIVYTANNGATVKSHFYTDGTSGFVGTQTNHYFGFTTNNQERGRFTAGGNLLIGTTTDGGYKLRVNGTGRYDDYLQLWSGTAGASPRLIFGGETSSTDKSIFLESYYMVFQGHNNEGFKFQTTSSLGAVSNRMSILGNGTVVLSNYGSGSKTGTVAYNLAVDASGNVIETAGGVVDGSGTANYVTKWQDANTVTNSSITDDGTTVTATAANFVSQSNLGTAYTSFTTSGTTAIFDTITRTDAAIYQIVIVANPNSAGSGSYQDFYYGKVFIGTGYNGSAVVQFINYHQESPMPRGLYGSGGGDLTVTAVMLVSGSEVTEVANGTSYTIRIKIAGYQVAGAGTTVRLQRIM